MFSEFVIHDTRCISPAIIFCNVRFDIWNVQALLSFVSEGVKTTPPASISVSLASYNSHDDLSRPFSRKTYITDTMDNSVWPFLSDQQQIVKWDVSFPHTYRYSIWPSICGSYFCFISSTSPFILQRYYLFCPSFSILLYSPVRYNTLDFIINYLLNKFVIPYSNLIFDIIIACLAGSHCTTT